MAKPVVASDVGGLRELVEDQKTGLLFEAGDEIGLERQLRRLVDDQELRCRLGAEGRQFVERERQWRVLVQRYRDVYAAASARCAQSHATQIKA
jgi:glycosyltransferase involved in cell wall biosynthesis